jgi:hypothetical protein
MDDDDFSFYDEEEDELFGRLMERGVEVFSHVSAVDGSDVFSSDVLRLGKEYYIVWDDARVNGPFTRLDSAINGGLQAITEQTVEIEAPGMSDKKLGELLVYEGVEEPHTFLVNGCPWTTQGGGHVGPVGSAPVKFDVKWV